MPDEPETIDTCQACEAPMDVSGFAPFSMVACPNCGEHSRVKLSFGPYSLIRRHAIGGMSMVFVAHDSTLDREVIVKILSEEYSQDETRINAFEEEAKITASFSHPNVVRVLRTGKAFGRFYIAMELVDGGHFEHHIRERGKIPEIELLPLAIEVAQGLKAAQAAGLIHRDVKPGNILLDTEGHAKLVDFGLALVTKEGKATASELWATPFYVPPETVEGKEEDFRSDIYALGSTLYHALAGTPPCNEASMSTTLLLKAKQEIVPLHKVAPEISEKTCQIVAHAMAYLPENRFSSYDEMIQLLSSAHKQAKNQASNPTSPQRSRNSKPNKILLTSAALAVTAIITTFALWPQPKHGNQGGTPGGQPNNPAPNPPLNTSNEIAQAYREGKQHLKEKTYDKSAAEFARLFQNSSVQEPSRTWAGMESIISHYLNSDSRQAREQAREIQKHCKDNAESTSHIGTKLPEILNQLESLRPIDPAQTEDDGARQVIAAMLGGLKNWEQGLLDPAAECFKLAASCKLSADEQWAGTYQQVASDYLNDYHILTGPLFEDFPKTDEDCKKTVEALNEELNKIKTRGRARFNVRAWQIDIARHAKTLQP